VGGGRPAGLYGGARQRAPNASSNSESIAAQERRSAAAL
jgi:hypothetical protein